MSTVEQAANTAIFQRQLPFLRAMRFVMQETGSTEKEAKQALNGVMLWYRAS